MGGGYGQQGFSQSPWDMQSQMGMNQQMGQQSLQMGARQSLARMLGIAGRGAPSLPERCDYCGHKCLTEDDPCRQCAVPLK